MVWSLEEGKVRSLQFKLGGGFRVQRYANSPSCSFFSLNRRDVGPYGEDGRSGSSWRKTLTWGGLGLGSPTVWKPCSSQ